MQRCPCTAPLQAPSVPSHASPDVTRGFADALDSGAKTQAAPSQEVLRLASPTQASFRVSAHRRAVFSCAQLDFWYLCISGGRGGVSPPEGRKRGGGQIR